MSKKSLEKKKKKKKSNVNAPLDKFITSIFGILPCYNFLWIHHDLLKYSLLFYIFQKRIEGREGNQYAIENNFIFNLEHRNLL